MQLPTPPQNQLCSIYVYLEAFCSLVFCFVFVTGLLFCCCSLELTLHLLQYIQGLINSNIAPDWHKQSGILWICWNYTCLSCVSYLNLKPWQCRACKMLLKHKMTTIREFMCVLTSKKKEFKWQLLSEEIGQ